MGGRGASYDKNKIIDHLSKEMGPGGKITPMDVEQFKGMSLEQIEARLRNLKHEELFAIDKDGNIVAAYKGNGYSVSFPQGLLEAEGITTTHGHPKHTAEFGGTFSFADMKSMLESKWAEHRATASGQGEMNYILKRGAKANPKGFYNRINRDYDRLKAKMSTAYDKAYKKATGSGTPKNAAMHVARQALTGVLNHYYKKTAKVYGFNYVTRKETYAYGR